MQEQPKITKRLFISCTTIHHIYPTQCSWCGSPWYPTIFNRPIISPTVKKPKSSAPTMPMVANCFRLTLRMVDRMLSGFAMLLMLDTSVRGLLRAFATGWKYA